MIVIGVTGSIGMGKSVAAAMLSALGIPVHDADQAVHELLGPGGAGVAPVLKKFPFYPYMRLRRRDARGRVFIDRAALGHIVFRDDTKRESLERILHPLVRDSQESFLRHQRAAGHRMAALDIPLLFETGGEKRVDYTIVVTAPGFLQEARVLSRPGMTREKFHAILRRQMLDSQKRSRADFVLNTGLGRTATMHDLKKILAEIKRREKLTA